ncbi:MAG: cysteine desulfurase [Saprospiraceae bacterium]|jgi:cysteine desulfurase|nr:cysteine desulfurase [Saprospiraceae bacterium]MBL0026017.1 cysteine desulfurase [Saprospiraceae bacterium]
MRVYLDNASTTPLLPEVINKMNEILNDDFGNPSSIHSYGRRAKSIVENARKIVSKAINASIGEIFFTSSATESNNMVLKNAVDSLQIKKIISSPTEHHCVLHTLDYLVKNKNIEISYVHVDNQGNINLTELSKLLDASEGRTLVSIMHGNNEIGSMIDLIKVGELCRSHEAYFHCDTVQTVGKYNIDVQKSPISFLSGSAHKFHGPKGAGFVYINNENMIGPFIHGGSQERNMRAGTENVAGIAGLALALENSCANMQNHYDKIYKLRTSFKKLLVSEFDDIIFNGNQDNNFLAHILSVSFPPGPKADMLVLNLDIAGICASSGSACTAGIEEDSHVLQAINHPNNRKTIRFSFSPFNTEKELIYTIEQLKGIT